MYIHVTHLFIFSQLFSTRGIIPVHSLCTLALHMYPYFHSLLSTGGIIPVHSVRTSTPPTCIHASTVCFPPRGIIPAHSMCTFTPCMYPHPHSLLSSGGIMPVHSTCTFILLTYIQHPHYYGGRSPPSHTSHSRAHYHYHCCSLRGYIIHSHYSTTSSLPLLLHYSTYMVHSPIISQ
jgi:hypothetical protein